jgi:CheY-like chemotaxis protein
MSLRTYEHRLNDIQLETQFEPNLPQVIADGSQLQQALLNLVLNAEQALRNRTTRRLRVGARFDQTAAAVELFVADTGQGIDEANLSRIFDPFFTTRDVGEGTGLGLSICYGIVRDHGGQITVDSRVGVGTTFSLLLPARVETAIDPDPILVAHADQGERDYLAAVLAGWGHAVITAGSTAEALAQNRDGRVQALFVDRGVIEADLPAWRAARASSRPVAPLILISMSADDGAVERFGREQASAVLAPPFQLRAVRSAIRAVARECV